ncbi:MAG TPA: hypothetical protein ENK91_07010 [Bacteroidetes bacterium]|nr:hypothetical protein [Bacteroidota bacterium]
MKYIISIILVLLIFVFAYFLYQSIAEPIRFTSEKAKREKLVIKNLKDIRKSQEIFREITDSFANNFDTLIYVLKHDSIPVIKILGNPDEISAEEQVEYDTIYFSALDSLNKMNVNLDSMIYVPFSGGKKFDIQAGEIDYQKTKVNVVEVGTRYKEFMGKYADKAYKKYETGYDPDNQVKFGDLNSPNLTGNWE